MRAAGVCAGLALLGLSGCALGQDIYDDEAKRQCRELPTAEERLQCERDRFDAERDRELQAQRGLIQQDRYLIPADICRTGEEDACPEP